MVGKTQYDTKSQLLGDFLSADEQTVLQIPHYQRGYSWTSDQISDFINDLLEQSKSTDQYYFGTITTIDHGDKNGAHNFELIDGQQRITSSIILLTCIRDILNDMNSPLIDEVNKEIFNMDIDKTKNEHYKLILDDEDDIYFRDNILNKLSLKKIEELKTAIPTVLDTHVNLRNAYLKMRQEIANVLDEKPTEKEKTDFLNLLRSTLRKKFIISNLDVEKASKAYILFNRMNDRGLQLAPADLAKDLVLSKISEEAQTSTGMMTMDVGIKKWKDLERKTQKKKGTMNNYIHHYLVTYHSQHPKKGYVFHTNSKTFDDLEEILKNNMMTGGGLLNEISTKFTNYEALKKAPNTSHPKISSDCKEILFWINELGILIVYPVLMAGLEKYSKDDFTKLADVLLKWFFRAKTIGNRNASALEEELANIGHKIYHKNLSVAEVVKELSESIHNISQNVFENNIKEISIGRTTARYILTKIIEKLQHKKISDVVPEKNITVEHIMPQKGIEKNISVPKLKPDGTVETDASGNEIVESFVWLNYIKQENKITDDRDAKSFHQNYKNRLGNLTLIDRKKNSVLGVYPFKIKCNAGKDRNGVEKGCFKNSQILITNEIPNWSVWNKESIEERQKKLAAIAIEIWKI